MINADRVSILRLDISVTLMMEQFARSQDKHKVHATEILAIRWSQMEN